jgi:hypothetical protein
VVFEVHVWAPAESVKAMSTRYEPAAVAYDPFSPWKFPLTEYVIVAGAVPKTPVWVDRPLNEPSGLITTAGIENFESYVGVPVTAGTHEIGTGL